MLNVTSLNSFTNREGFAKAFSLTISEIPAFVRDNDHHVAEIYCGLTQVGIWTDSMGFVWKNTSFLWGYMVVAGGNNDHSFYGFSSEDEIEIHMLRTDLNTAKIQNPNGIVVGFWSRSKGITWIGENPFGPVKSEEKILGQAFAISGLTPKTQLAASDEISLDRKAVRKVVETGEAVEASEDVKLAIAKVAYLKETNGSVDWKELTDDECWEYFNHMIQTNTQWLRRAVVAIFNHQTSDEQVAGQTKHHNGVGFNGVDAEMMTNIAQRIIANSRSLTEREVTAARKTMRKYVRQLVRIMRSS